MCILLIVYKSKIFYNVTVKYNITCIEKEMILVYKKVLSLMMLVCILGIVTIPSIIPAYADVSSEDSITDIIGCDCNGAWVDDMVPVLDSSVSVFSNDVNGALPSTVDLSASESFPCIRDQGNSNSCVGWATTYYQFGYQVATMNDWNAKTDTTKQFSPRWTYNFINRGYDSGCFSSEAYKFLSVHGAVRYSEFTPSTNGSQYEHTAWYVDKEDTINALRYRVSDYQRYYFSESTDNTPITSYNDTELYNMKRWLNNGNVLVISTDSIVWVLDKLPEMSSNAGEHVCIRHEDRDHGRSGHAMAVVGYDDNIQYDLNGDGIIQDYEKGAFKVANSIGNKYCNRGFIWVMYDALNKESNTEEQNIGIRNAIFEDYSYYVITVSEYPLELVAEVSITATARNQTTINLKSSDWNSFAPQDEVGTLFSGLGGALSFSGLENVSETATFPFDLGSVVESSASWKNYYIEVIDDSTNNNRTVINRIDILDSNGEYVVSDTDTKIIDGTNSCYRYMIGLVGDVNNSGSVNTFDVTALQSYLANGSTLSTPILKVSDVNDDGDVNSFDVTCIQRVLAGINSGFDKGIYTILE